MSSNISHVRCEVKTKFSFVGKIHMFCKKIIPIDAITFRLPCLCSERKNGYFLLIAHNLQ